jgi:hypothetical protein
MLWPGGEFCGCAPRQFGKCLKFTKAGLSQKRLFMENSLFLAWVSEQEAKGRPESELIFGNFVRERFAN